MRAEFNQILEKNAAYLERGTDKKTINSAIEPVVKLETTVISIPSGVWDNSQFGDPWSLFSYLAAENDIPKVAKIELDYDDVNRKMNVTYSWWSIVARVAT